MLQQNADMGFRCWLWSLLYWTGELLYWYPRDIV